MNTASSMLHKTCCEGHTAAQEVNNNEQSVASGHNYGKKTLSFHLHPQPVRTDNLFLSLQYQNTFNAVMHFTFNGMKFMITKQILDSFLSLYVCVPSKALFPGYEVTGSQRAVMKHRRLKQIWELLPKGHCVLHKSGFGRVTALRTVRTTKCIHCHPLWNLWWQLWPHRPNVQYIISRLPEGCDCSDMCCRQKQSCREIVDLKTKFGQHHFQNPCLSF